MYLLLPQVRTWFQNRRMKLKREVQDYLAPQISPMTFQPLQYHAVAAQQAHYPAPGLSLYPLPVPQLVLPQQLTPHPSPQLMIRYPHFYWSSCHKRLFTPTQTLIISKCAIRFVKMLYRSCWITKRSIYNWIKLFIFIEEDRPRCFLLR